MIPLKRASLLICSLAFFYMLTACSQHNNIDLPQEKQVSSPTWDLMVIAPHPDDETLGNAGVIMQALQEGKQVGIVVLTNGDSYPTAAAMITGVDQQKLTSKHFVKLASTRQQYVTKALSLIEFPLDNLHFLGYPDGGLDKIYNEPDNIYHNILTGKSNTYKAHQIDYHSKKHGQTAPYTKASIIADLVNIIKTKQPKNIHVTSLTDGHGDHQAAFKFARDAAIKADYQGNLNTYLIHSSKGHSEWPYPYKVDLTAKFQAHTLHNETIPSGLAWPPSIRSDMTLEQAQKKLEMINQFEVEIQLASQYMRAFAKAEEIFWSVPINSPKN